jgi:histone H1/5
LVPWLSLQNEMPTELDDTAVAAASPSNASTCTGTSVKSKRSKSATPKSAKSAKSRNGKESTEKENKSSSRRSSGKLTYQQYVHQAIVDMKDRTGSSLPAISKWILANYNFLGDSPSFKTHLAQALKQGVKSQHFAKIKASFKISPEWTAKERATKKRKLAAAKKQADDAKKAKEKAKAAKAPVTLAETKESNAKKLKALQETMSVEDLEKARVKMERQEQLKRERLEADRKAKERADKLRRRRFPMEDTKLHAEDKDLNVKPPADVIPRPYMPYFWHSTLSLDHPARLGKTSSQVLTASKVDGLDYGNRGVVPDLLQIYHFFRGDVHYTGDDDDHPVVPDFTLQHLNYSVDQLLLGHARRERLVPPLLSHLFCTCLQILCQGPIDNDVSLSVSETKLRKDLHKHLLPALSPASWSDVLFLYMDAMERYYSSDTTQENVLPSLNTDMEYLMGVKDQPVVPMTPAANGKHGEEGVAEQETILPLPGGYTGYLGDPRGVLFKAHAKLARQDPWQLTAEELLTLLRALTDDCLATHPAISDDIAAREEEMHELLRNKRAADAKFRKVRVAFEGPKRPAPRKLPNSTEDKGETAKSEIAKDETAKEDGLNGKQKGADVENEDGNEKPKAEEVFKPTATKKQFETAGKAQQKASDAYEKGIRKLVARTEPVGYDRDNNAIYCFRHDPEILYVEDFRAPSSAASHLPSEMQIARRSWHVIETTSLFDQFTSSLDIRGKRENDLYEELLGPPGAQQSLRRYLHDDIKEQAAVNARLREKEALKERLEKARKKCDEESRRSGRLAGNAERELEEIEKEINGLEKKINGESVPEPRDYEELTGLALLRKFDSTGRMETRRTREKKVTSVARKFPMLPCSKLWSTGNIDGTGLPGMLVSSMLELEEHCNSLTPWEREDVSRSAWISRLEGAIYAWNDMSPTLLGSPDASRSGNGMNGDSAMVDPSDASNRRDSVNSSASERKRRKLESPVASTAGSAQPSMSQIITILKQPLLDLEARVAEITNLAVATRDAELADDNMSTDGSEEDKTNNERLERAWKKIVNRMRNTPTKRYVQIREMLVDAITAARKAHLSEVVFKLRAALLQYHPNAAGQCKASAIKVLQEHGDYDEDDDDLEDEDDEGNEDAGDTEEEMPSVISAEAAILVSSLQGSDDASRVDWIGGVKNCKTISRLAALTAAFVHNAKEKFEKIEVERDELTNALAAWGKEEERRVKNRAGKKTAGKPPKETVGPSEVWANVGLTDNICMAKAEAYPWWPAKKCEPKDPELARLLSNLNRSLVSLVGEMGGLRVVKNENIVPFTGQKIEEDGSETEVSKDIRSQLDDCMTMARRILRGRPNTAAS